MAHLKTAPLESAEEHLPSCPLPVAQEVANSLYEAGIWRPDEPSALHRTSGCTVALRPDQVSLLHDLGDAIWSFYKAVNQLWFRKDHAWAREWLDSGKPEWLLDFARMNFSKRHLPRLLRPDLILGHDQMWVTELDSVPGGAGETAAISRALALSGEPVIGGADGIVRNFADTLADLSGSREANVAIIVSDEAESYRSEMTYLAARLRQDGQNVWCVHPRDVTFDEEGLWLSVDGTRVHVDVVWRFYELFDLKNIPRHELVMYAAKKKLTIVSPPYKPHLEEKLALALLHHPALEDFWASEMGNQFSLLRSMVPHTWVLDPRPVPAHAEISGLRFRNRPVRDFVALAEASQTERRLVIKHSGYSPLAWGARSVVVGHDTSQQDWAHALGDALEGYPKTPHILQEFQEGKRIEIEYYDPAAEKTGTMMGRARLSPYYYVVDDKPVLSGVLATICSADKKIIHGMVDAVMTVCSEGKLEDV